MPHVLSHQSIFACLWIHGVAPKPHKTWSFVKIKNQRADGIPMDRSVLHSPYGLAAPSLAQNRSFPFWTSRPTIAISATSTADQRLWAHADVYLQIVVAVVSAAIVCLLLLLLVVRSNLFVVCCLLLMVLAAAGSRGSYDGAGTVVFVFWFVVVLVVVVAFVIPMARPARCMMDHAFHA